MWRFKRLPYVVIAIMVGLNAVPRMSSSGKQHWFVATVPDPGRFISEMRRAGHPPNATLFFGCPLRFYSEFGRGFATKDKRTLFLPSEQQLSFNERFSLIALTGDVGLIAGIGALLLFAMNRFSSQKESPHVS